MGELDELDEFERVLADDGATVDELHIVRIRRALDALLDDYTDGQVTAQRARLRFRALARLLTLVETRRRARDDRQRQRRGRGR